MWWIANDFESCNTCMNRCDFISPIWIIRVYNLLLLVVLLLLLCLTNSHQKPNSKIIKALNCQIKRTIGMLWSTPYLIIPLLWFHSTNTVSHSFTLWNLLGYSIIQLFILLIQASQSLSLYNLIWLYQCFVFIVMKYWLRAVTSCVS